MFSVVLFFFKQKTAYEMRISDWSSDVCSSDLPLRIAATAVSILPWPEIISTGSEGSRFLISSSSSRPSIRELCNQTSSSTSEGRRASIAPSAASLLAAVRGSEEHTSELQSLMRISYAVFSLKKKKKRKQ